MVPGPSHFWNALLLPAAHLDSSAWSDLRATGKERKERPVRADAITAFPRTFPDLWGKESGKTGPGPGEHWCEAVNTSSDQAPAVVSGPGEPWKVTG